TVLQFVFFEFELRHLERRSFGRRLLGLCRSGSFPRALGRRLRSSSLLTRRSDRKNQKYSCSEHQDTLVMRLHPSFLSDRYRLILTAGHARRLPEEPANSLPGGQ